MERELFAAIRAKNKERPRQLLEMGADVNAYEPAEICRDEKDPCICIPIGGGCVGLGLLIGIGINPGLSFCVLPGLILFTCGIKHSLNDTNNYKKTPLHVAVTTGDPDMVALLLEFGADRNAPAALMDCCCCKYTPTQFVDSIPPEQRAPIKELLME